MGKVFLDASSVNAVAIPNMNSAYNFLKNALSISNNFNNTLPSNFQYKNIVSGFASKIGNSSKSIDNTKKSIQIKLNDANNIESRANSRTLSIATQMSYANISDTGAKTSSAKNLSTQAAATVTPQSATGAKTTKKSQSAWDKFVSWGSKQLDKLADTGAKIVDGLCEAKDWVVDTATDLYQDAKQAVVSAYHDVTEFASDAYSLASDWIKTAYDDTVEWVDNAIKDTGAWIANAADAVWSWLCDTGEKAWEIIRSTLASIANVVLSFVKGLVEVIEAIGDLILLIAGGIDTLVFGIVDIIEGIKTGNWDWAYTKSLWRDAVVPLVSYSWTNALDQKIGVRQALDQWAYEPFKSDGIACQIADGVGYVAGIIAITVLTFGVGGAAIGGASGVTSTTLALTAGAAGVGRAGEEAFQSEMKQNAENQIRKDLSDIQITQEMYDLKLAELMSMDSSRNYTQEEVISAIYNDIYTQSMSDLADLGTDWDAIKKYSQTLTGGQIALGNVYAVGKGLIEGGQWWVGGQINGAFKGASSVVTNKFAGALLRVGMDSVDSAIEVPLQDLLQMLIRTDENGNHVSFGDVWNEHGGWRQVLIQAGIGAIGSTGGEAFDAIGSARAMKNLSKMLNDGSIDADQFSKSISKLSDLELRQFTDSLDDVNRMAVLSNVDGKRFADFATALKYDDAARANVLANMSDKNALLFLNTLDDAGKISVLSSMDGGKFVQFADSMRLDSKMKLDVFNNMSNTNAILYLETLDDVNRMAVLSNIDGKRFADFATALKYDDVAKANVLANMSNTNAILYLETLDDVNRMAILSNVDGKRFADFATVLKYDDVTKANVLANMSNKNALLFLNTLDDAGKISVLSSMDGGKFVQFADSMRLDSKMKVDVFNNMSTANAKLYLNTLDDTNFGKFIGSFDNAQLKSFMNSCDDAVLIRYSKTALGSADNTSLKEFLDVLTPSRSKIVVNDVIKNTDDIISTLTLIANLNEDSFDAIMKNIRSIDADTDTAKFVKYMIESYADGNTAAVKKYNHFFKNFRDHSIGHSVNVTAYAKKFTEMMDNCDSIEAVYGALCHDFGMSGGYVIVDGKLLKQLQDVGCNTYNVGEVIEIDSLGLYKFFDEDGNLIDDFLDGLTRKNHPLNSAVDVLIHADDFPDGVDTDVVALLAMSHSKSTSGIRHFSTKEEWEDAVAKLDTVVKHYNNENPTSQISFNVEELKKKLDDPKLFERLQNEALCVREGDAMSDVVFRNVVTEDGRVLRGTLMQDGNIVVTTYTDSRPAYSMDKFDSKNFKANSKAEYAKINDVVYTPDGKEVRTLENTGGDLVSKRIHMGEANLEFDSSITGKDYFASMTPRDANTSPYATFEAIKERIGEANTYTNCDTRRVEIVLPKEAKGTELGKWYEDALSYYKNTEDMDKKDYIGLIANAEDEFTRTNKPISEEVFKKQLAFYDNIEIVYK